MGKRIGLICRGRGMPKLAAQRTAVIEAGVAEADVWEDDESRKKRDEWIMTGRAVEEGDTLVVPLLAALSTAKERRTIMRKVARLGVQVEDLKADVVKVKRTGRPPKLQPTAEDKAVICEMWWNKNVSFDEGENSIVAVAARRGLYGLNRAMVKRWCGLARKRPEDDE